MKDESRVSTTWNSVKHDLSGPLPKESPKGRRGTGILQAEKAFKRTPTSCYFDF